jgi:hypothetical protein
MCCQAVSSWCYEGTVILTKHHEHLVLWHIVVSLNTEFLNVCCLVTPLKHPIHSQTERFYCVMSYLTEKLSKLRSFDGIAQASELSFPVFHTENCAVHSGNPTVSSVYLPTLMASSQGTDENWQKNWPTWWETCAVQENIHFSFLCIFFFTQLNCAV